LGFLDWPHQHLLSWLHDLPEVVSAGLHVDDYWVCLLWSWIIFLVGLLTQTRSSTDLKTRTLGHKRILGIRIGHILCTALVNLIPSKS